MKTVVCCPHCGKAQGGLVMSDSVNGAYVRVDCDVCGYMHRVSVLRYGPANR